MKSIALLIFCLVFWSCNSSQSVEEVSPELQKVFLTEVFFPGDEVVTEGQFSGWVLQTDSIQANLLLKKGLTSVRRLSEIQKVSSAKLFRGSEPGTPLEWVKLCEPSLPRYQDSLGLSYMYSLGNGKSFRVDYYVLPGVFPARVQSIFMESNFELESDAIRFYREVSEHLERQYDSPNGQLGDFTWGIPQKSAAMHLSLSGQKKVVTLSIDFLKQTQTDN